MLTPYKQGGAVCQLAAPMMGAWSDRAGRRMPFLSMPSITLLTFLSTACLVRAAQGMNVAVLGRSGR